MQTWRVELTTGEQSLAEVKIQRGLFQGYTVSPLLFVIAMIPPNHILRKCTAGYKVSKLQEKINHWRHQTFCPKRKRIENPNTNCSNVQSIYWNGIWHRKMHHASNEKWQTTNNGRSRTTKSGSHQNAQRNGNLQILGDIGNWHHQTIGNENKLKKSISEEPENYSR